MASEKQIAANRGNAKRSKGPTSVLGKLASSRNAYRHGLSSPLQFDRPISEKAEAFARLLVDEDISDEQSATAAEFAEAQLELLRIRAVRLKINREIRRGGGPNKKWHWVRFVKRRGRELVSFLVSLVLNIQLVRRPSPNLCDPQQLRRLAALDRYERLAHTRSDKSKTASLTSRPPHYPQKL